MIPIGIQNLPDEYLFPVGNLIDCNRRLSTVIDLFAGDGTTLDYLAWHWKATPHAIEINPKLAEQCTKRFLSDGVVVCADMLSIRGPAAFDIVYAYPPYGNQPEIDITYLNHAISFVRPGGVLIYAIHQTQFTFAHATIIYNHASDLNAWTAPAGTSQDNLNIIAAQINSRKALGYDPNEIAMFTKRVQSSNMIPLEDSQNPPAFSIQPHVLIDFQN